VPFFRIRFDPTGVLSTDLPHLERTFYPLGNRGGSYFVEVDYK